MAAARLRSSCNLTKVDYLDRSARLETNIPARDLPDTNHVVVAFALERRDSAFDRRQYKTFSRSPHAS